MGYTQFKTTKNVGENKACCNDVARIKHVEMTLKYMLRFKKTSGKDMGKHKTC